MVPIGPMNTQISRFYQCFVIFAKYINFHKMAKFKYFAKQMAYSKSPGQMSLLKQYIAHPYSESSNFFQTTENHS